MHVMWYLSDFSIDALIPDGIYAKVQLDLSFFFDGSLHHLLILSTFASLGRTYQ
jgi:hypothetical protein